MIYVNNESDNPFFNHALEEYVLKNMDEDVFILWKNRPAILIGRNQNTLTEINEEYVKGENIDVVRRLSGGGTVFNDYGNINFTFITKKSQNQSSLKNGFEKFALPVIKALESLGVRAIFTGRNDILVDEKKISGNAQYYYKNKILHHGTLLFSGNLDKLGKALKMKPLKYQDKGVKSVRSRVTNISEHLSNKMDVMEFKNYLKEYIMEYYNIREEYVLNNQEIEQVIEIQKNRFESKEWNYGKISEYNFLKEEKFTSGTVEILMRIRNGIIEKLKIHGDFFGEKSILILENILQGSGLDEEEIMLKLQGINVDDYIKGLSLQELVGLLTLND